MRDCAAGSEEAWEAFYARFIGLVRTVVRRRLGPRSVDIDDIAQNVFVAIIPSLKTYDPSFPLQKFICLVAERTCIQEYRKTTASKRAVRGESIHRGEGSEERRRAIPSADASPEEKLANMQLLEVLKEAMRSLGARCRELLRLRFYEDLPYKTIAGIMDASENTLAVNARRCMEDLKSIYFGLMERRK